MVDNAIIVSRRSQLITHNTHNTHQVTTDHHLHQQVVSLICKLTDITAISDAGSVSTEKRKTTITINNNNHHHHLPVWRRSKRRREWHGFNRDQDRIRLLGKGPVWQLCVRYIPDHCLHNSRREFIYQDSVAPRTIRLCIEFCIHCLWKYQPLSNF